MIPEVELHIESSVIVAKSRKLKANWTFEAQQDWFAMHSPGHVRELTVDMTDGHRKIFQMPDHRTIDDDWSPSKL